MGKHTKLATPDAPAKSSAAQPAKSGGAARKGERKTSSRGTAGGDAASVNGEVDEMLREELGHLRTLRATVSAALAAGEATPALVRESAGVARALVAVSGEIRQREKHARQQVADMTPEEADALVAEYLRELTKERRAELREFLDELDREEAVLG